MKIEIPNYIYIDMPLPVSIYFSTFMKNCKEKEVGKIG
jgi:hypothetical protein